MKVYLSKANNLPDGIRNKYIKALTNIYGENHLLMHNGGVYKDDKLNKSEVVYVGTHPDHTLLVGKGVYSEVLSALNQKKSVYALKINAKNEILTMRVLSVKISNSNDWKDRYGELKLSSPDLKIKDLKKKPNSFYNISEPPDKLLLL